MVRKRFRNGQYHEHTRSHFLRAAVADEYRDGEVNRQHARDTAAGKVRDRALADETDSPPVVATGVEVREDDAQLAKALRERDGGFARNGIRIPVDMLVDERGARCARKVFAGVG